jgi:hypothetical protein
LHEENSKPEEEKTSIKPAIPKHAHFVIIKPTKTTIKTHDWKCPHYKTYREF